MSDLNIPFNISLLSLTPEKLRAIRPITSLDDFSGASNNFHPDGLYSVEIFGKVGDTKRSTRFSYIDIKVPIFHPIIYNALVAMKQLYGDIIMGSQYARWNADIKDFERATPLDGKTGFNFFMSHWKDIEFKRTESDKREQNILLIQKYMNDATTSKVVVMPAGLRDMEITKDGRMQKDEINSFYWKLLSVANTVSELTLKQSPELLDSARVSLQLTFNKIYDTIEAMVAGKKKLILGKWGSRRIFNGTRNVITAMDTTVKYLGAKGNPGVNSTIVGLYQALKTISPVAIFNIKNGFLSKVFSGPQMPVKLVDKKTLKSVELTVNPLYFAKWMTDEGLEKTISLFQEEDVRNKPVEIEGHYIGLIYKGPDNTFRFMQSIDELPTTRSKDHVFPITFCELLYLSTYMVLDNYPVLVTRYPITGIGSIYPSMMHVLTTVKAEQRAELDENWAPIDDKHVASQFPTNSAFMNSASPHPIKLKGLGADFDGDMSSVTAVYSDEAVKEVKDYLTTRRAYVGSDGKFMASVAVDTVELALFNMTGH